jgi:hypothetical protein
VARRIIATAAALAVLATTGSVAGETGKSLAVQAAAQTVTPTNKDLHSAYCSAVLKGQIPWMQREIVARVDATAAQPAASSEEQQTNTKLRTAAHEFLAKLQSAQDRIDSYLRPRLPTLDPAAVLLATNRGETDWRDAQEQMKTGHVDETLATRTRACAEPTWLP